MDINVLLGKRLQVEADKAAEVDLVAEFLEGRDIGPGRDPGWRRDGNRARAPGEDR